MTRRDQTSQDPGERSDAQQALLRRRSISIRTRVFVSFLVIFVLVGAITVAAVIFISRFTTKLQFLETVGNYSFEVQQARRFEKNFFLYDTNLADAVASIHVAQNLLENNVEELRSVVGDRKYDSMLESLSQYNSLLEDLLEWNGGEAPEHESERRQIEARLRKHGARIMSDAQEMIDRERRSMHATIDRFCLTAMVFLAFMCLIMFYNASFIIRSVVKPLARFVSYTARIGGGDYSPIMPVRKYRDEFSDLAIAVNKMLDELKLRQEQLLQSGKMAAVGTLTSGIAHELNNPLNNIGITVEALINEFSEYTDDEKLKMLNQVYMQVERASGTVRNLLDFTRKEQTVFTPVSVEEIVTPALRLVSNELRLAGVEPKVTIPDRLPTIAGNPRNLQQVFLNLFLNAIQAMPDGGSLEVAAATTDDGFVRIDVKDTGHGIAGDQIDRIFDPFFTTKDPGVGTGLGLAVSYGIVEKHGGRITVASEQGKGTTFSVFLPLEVRSGNGRDEPA